MLRSKLFYELSTNVDIDIEEIFDYTKEVFGFDQAVEYLYQLESVFEKLLNSPELGTKRDEIKIGLRSFPKEGHIVFYRILNNNKIRIVRILHHIRDAHTFLE